jgi:glycosidase
VIYYGDEFGMTGANDPDNRRMMRFDEELSPLECKQLEKVSKIINLRKEHSALRRGDYLNIHTEKDVMIYSRGDIFERLIVVLNKSSVSQSLIFQLPNWLNCNSLSSLLSNTTCIKVTGNKVNCKISAYSADLLLVNQKD